MITTYVIDDETHAVATISSYISRTPGLNLLGAATNAAEGVHYVRNVKQPGLLFLDVDMPEINGVELAKLLDHRLPIIFTTAYKEYAVEAFELRAVDYLLKPFSYARFLEAVQRIQQAIKAPVETNQLFVRTGIKGQLERVVLSELIYAESMENYVLLHLKNGSRMIHVPISELSTLLQDRGFVRVHKSYIVNIKSVDRIEPGQLKLANQIKIPLGRAYRGAFFQQFNKLILRP